MEPFSTKPHPFNICTNNSNLSAYIFLLRDNFTLCVNNEIFLKAVKAAHHVLQSPRSIWFPICHLLACNMWPLGVQKTTYCNAIRHLLENGAK